MPRPGADRPQQILRGDVMSVEEGKAWMAQYRPKPDEEVTTDA